jgi:hypothetical protein
MTNFYTFWDINDQKTTVSPAFEKGHFDGLVDDGEYLRQKLAFRAEFASSIVYCLSSIVCRLCGQKSV